MFLTLECDRLRAALRRFQQVDADSCFDALALDWPAAATATFPASKPESFEEVAENVKYVVDVLETASATSSTADTFMAKAVVASPFLFVAENVIRLGRFFETFDRGIVARVPIRVVLDSEFFEGLFDHIRRSVTRHTQDFIIVALCRHDPLPVRNNQKTGRQLARRVDGRSEYF